jgi:hypothetical protein
MGDKSGLSKHGADHQFDKTGHGSNGQRSDEKCDKEEKDMRDMSVSHRIIHSDLRKLKVFFPEAARNRYNVKYFFTFRKNFSKNNVNVKL